VQSRPLLSSLSFPSSVFFHKGMGAHSHTHPLLPLEQRSTGKPDWLCSSLLPKVCSHSALPFNVETANDDMEMNGVAVSLYLCTLKFEFHIILTCHEVLFVFKSLFSTIKNVKTILSSQAVQNQAAGQIWPSSHSVPIPCSRMCCPGAQASQSHQAVSHVLSFG
jgi:hypothetical protein